MLRKETRTAGLLLTTVMLILPIAMAGEMDAWVGQLEGGWTGSDNVTPMGRMSFAMLFERQEDGSLVSHSAMNRETWIRLQFFKDDRGRWLLRQGGALEGLGQQSSVLVPMEGEGGVRRWADPERPDYLHVDIGIDDSTLFMEVTLRGQQHARFQLARLADDDVPALRQSLAEGRNRSPEEASIFDHTADGTVPSSLELARAEAVAQPDSARAHMRVANLLIELIQADGSQAPLYAAELLASLNRALESDPKMAEAYEGLVGYYLNAPPIAGGSIEKAHELAQRLVDVDPARGEALLQTVQAYRGGSASAH